MVAIAEVPGFAGHQIDVGSATNWVVARRSWLSGDGISSHQRVACASTSREINGNLQG